MTHADAQIARAWTPEGEPVPGEWEESRAGHFRRWCARWEQTPDEVVS